MEKMKNCGNCAAACGIEGKNEVVGCKEDGKLHNAQEQNTCFYVKDCDTCVHKFKGVDHAGNRYLRSRVMFPGI